MSNKRFRSFSIFQYAFNYVYNFFFLFTIEGEHQNYDEKKLTLTSMARKMNSLENADVQSVYWDDNKLCKYC